MRAARKFIAHCRRVCGCRIGKGGTYQPANPRCKFCGGTGWRP